MLLATKLFLEKQNTNKIDPVVVNAIGTAMDISILY